MKKVMLGIIALCFAGLVFAQKDPVSVVFEKYSGAEGITTVNVSGDMLNLLTQAEEQRLDTVFTSKISEIRILALEKGCDKPVTFDMRAEVYDKLDKSVYKEMISIKQQGEDVLILMKENQGRIAELLIFAGGDNEGALIQMKGDIVLSEMADMAGKFQMKGFDQLRHLEK